MGTIDKIDVFILKAPLGKAKFWSSQSSFPERNSLLVKISSGELSGWGEAGQYGPPEPVASAIKDVLAKKIIGKPIAPTVISDHLYSFSRDFGQRGTYIEAISGIDVALWDLLGKTLNVPVCKLLGGNFRDRVKVYATGCYYRHDSEDPSSIDIDKSIKACGDEAESFKEAGFKAVKIKVGLLSVEDDFKRIQATRNAIGPDIKLMVDANHAYNVTTAIKLAKKMEELDVSWFEEPVIPEDIEGYRRVKSKTIIPISGGECSFTRYGFRDLFVGRDGPCLDIAQPDIAASGGISEFMKISALASSFGVTIVPHVWGSGVGLAAALHAVSTLPLSPYTCNPMYMENTPVIEYDRNPNPLRDELLLNHKFILGENGDIEVPMNKPGLGVEVDHDALIKFTVDKFHVE